MKFLASLSLFVFIGLFCESASAQLFACPPIPGVNWPRDKYGCPLVPSGESNTQVEDFATYELAWTIFTESYKPNMLLSWFDDDYSIKSVKLRCPKYSKVGPGYPEDCKEIIAGGPYIDTPKEQIVSVAATNYLNSLAPATRDKALVAISNLTSAAQSYYVTDVNYAVNYLDKYYYWLRIKYPPNTTPTAADLKRVDDRAIVVRDLFATHALNLQVRLAAVHTALKANGTHSEVIGSTNGDGYTDLVTFDADQHVVNCYVRNSDGKGYKLVQQIQVQGAPGINLVDKNKDKKLDLVLRYVAQGGAVSEILYFGTGAGTFFPGFS